MLEERRNSLLLESSRVDERNYQSLLFLDPVKILSAQALGDIPTLFDDIEENLRKGFFVAGFLSYEAGYHFEKVVPRPLLHSVCPLAWFGVYQRPFVFNHGSGTFENEAPPSPVKKEETFSLTNFSFNMSETDYSEAISKIKSYIISGDTYQVNFTGKVGFRFNGSAAGCYASLRARQKVSYGSFINADGKFILSFSPELFFATAEGKIVTKPMKGTAPRGKNAEQDEAIKQWLENDEKNLSENLMIVDLLRNDIGRIANTGSVAAKEMFTVEKYETLFQMTSTVEGAIDRDLPLYEMIKSLFPSGSVTGAPKIRTMQIIHELESEPRGAYTGAIGWFSPSREAAFNVAIRTLLLDGNSGEMGVGSGIVYDSDPHQEYEECLLKADFLTQTRTDFQLIESILWDGEYRLLDLHLDRMKNSAQYFDFAFDPGTLRQELVRNRGQLSDGTRYKVRVLLNASGKITVTNQVLQPSTPEAQVTLSRFRTNSADKFLFHKTTVRERYEEELAGAIAKGFDDILFRNERDEITEGAISNIFIEKNGRLLTPPVSSGLLCGIYRRHLLMNGKADEHILTLDDLLHADAMFISNAVRGLRKVCFIPE